MKIQETINMIRSDARACAESLIRAVDVCDTVEEMSQLNVTLQSVRSVLQNCTYLVGKVIQETEKTPQG